ncbi:Na/Pi cotransporter family protein [Fusibacter sp. JL298sf-3]
MKSLFEILLPLFAGLGLFLYGMNIMSDGLEKSAGNKLEKIIEKLSGNIFKGILMGTFVTFVVQSSSATTVMVVGFVNAGIMNLTQAIGIIMGANIGTTITAQLVSIDVSALAPIAIVSGMAMRMFSKNNRQLVWGEVLLGFGILFFGMDVMKEAMSPLKDSQAFVEMIQNIGSGTWLGTIEGFALGLLITAVVQSSSATTGMLVALAHAGALPIEAAFPILLGSNVGTCVTAMISSVGANRTAKRAAWMHLLFNLVGSLIFLLFLSSLTIKLVTSMSVIPERQLANAHTLFNIANTLLLLPFAGLIVKAVKYILPVTEEEEQEALLEKRLLDDRFLETPSIAMGQVTKAVLQMGELAKKSLDSATTAVINNDYKMAKSTFKTEKKINALEREISEFLVKLSNTAIDADDRIVIDSLFDTINDIERVGDHADNIAELAAYKVDNNVRFSEKALAEMQEMVAKVMETYDYALAALNTFDIHKAKKAVEMEGVVDEMEKVLRKKHIARLNEGRCETSSGIVFLDLLSNLERVSDHASNIALATLDAKQS